AVSPDGRAVTYVGEGADRVPRLWLRPLDRPDAAALPGTENAMYPFWSPDSRAIAFFSNGKLRRIDVGGAAVQVLADTPSPRGGTWGVDGTIILSPTSTGALARVSANGGTLQPVALKGVAGKAGFGARWPQWLPDGRRFLF